MSCELRGEEGLWFDVWRGGGLEVAIVIYNQSVGWKRPCVFDRQCEEHVYEPETEER